jgi:hypothetical protein
VAKAGKSERKRSQRPATATRRGEAGRSSAPPSSAGPTLPGPRGKLDTLGYEDRPREPRPPHGSSPELITIEEAPIGRNTLHAIEQELLNAATPAMPIRMPTAQGASAEIFEISTFVVVGDEIYTKASEPLRRAFVEQRLLHRLPVRSMQDVVRIDLSRGPVEATTVLRVWTKVTTKG